MSKPEKLLTLSHGARELGIAPNTLRHHADTGRIECVRASDGSRLFPVSAIVREAARRVLSLIEKGPSAESKEKLEEVATVSTKRRASAKRA